MEVGTKSVACQQLKTYKKGSTPNDGLMALMYAFIAYRFHITRGFKVKQHKLESRGQGPILTYLPGV